jgi:hypothetical protein
MAHHMKNSFSYAHFFLRFMNCPPWFHVVGKFIVLPIIHLHVLAYLKVIPNMQGPVNVLLHKIFQHSLAG